MGKRTTTRHKEDNTFRFETFEEKLKNISVNVNLSIRDGRTDVPEDEATFFYQEIDKWTDLNRTESFGVLLQEIGTDVQSLPQVLLQKDRLAQVFLNHLDNPDNQASYEPTFALLVALARDLGQEIYPHFSKFFKSIIGIAISSKNSEIIEQGFKCYAYLSKYLRRQISRDLDQHLKLFAPLLNPKLKKYVVIFACEAFEVVVSKYARDHSKKFLDLVFNILLKNSPENATGVGTLLFAMFKGVGGSIKTQGLGFKLSDCIEYSSVIPVENRPSWIEMLNVLIRKLLSHGNSLDIAALFKNFEALMLPVEEKPISLIFPVYRMALEYENGAKIPDVYACVSVLKILTEPLLKTNLDEFAETIVSLIESKGKTTNPEILSSLKPIVIRLLECVDLKWIQKIDSTLQDTSNYFYFYLIPIVKAYERIQMSNTKEDQEINPLDNQTLRCISEAVIRQNGFYHMLNKEEHFFTGFSTPMWFYGSQKRLIRPLNMTNLSKDNFDCCSVILNAEKSLKSEFNIEILGRLFLSYSRMGTTECSNCYNTCLKIANLIISHHETCEATKESALSMLLFLVLETLVMHGPPDSWKTFQNLEVLKYLKNVEDVIVGAANSANPFSLWSLKCVDLIVHHAKLAESDELRQGIVEFLNELTEGLTSNLQSGFKIVRSLTLSVVRNVVSMKESEAGKLIEMYDKFLEIENMSLLSPKFASLAKSVLIECKVLLESENTSEDIKKVCLKYALGLLYSNFNLIWGVCIEAILLAGRHMAFPTFWNIFSRHFLMHFPESSVGTPRLNVLEGDADDKNEFLPQLEALVFGFPQTVSGSLGLEENLDIAQYRVNLWKSMSTLPLGKDQFAEIKSVIDKTITRTFENQSSERGLSGEINRTLVPMFEFLEKCDHASADLVLWEKSLDHLISTPDVQKACWEFLHAKRKNKLKNYKIDVDELIKSDSMDCVHKFRIDAIDTTQNKQYSNESVEKRRLLMDIVIRILIGKERKWKAEKRLQVLRFMGGCTESDAIKYLELTVGPALNDDRISPKAIEVKINKIASAIRTWRYKFPSMLDELLNVVCDLTVGISSLKKPFPRHSEEEELPDAVFEDQKKGALKAGRICIVAFFTFLAKFNLEESTVERIFEVFIWTGIQELKSHTGSNISWIMKLFHVWSSHERFHPLIAKCREGNSADSPMQGIFYLLASPVAQFDVRKYLLEILLNLASDSEIEDKVEIDENEEDQKLEHSEKMDGRPVACQGIHVFQTSESVGLNIVLSGKDVILNLFQDVPLFKRFVNQPEGDRCLGLISRLAEFVDEGEATGKLCSIVIETFAMYKYSEENLFHCLVACKNLLKKSSNTNALCLKLAQAFTWVTGRRLRTALCDILSAQKDTFVYENIRDLNAWTDLATDTPDFSKRHQAFQNILKAMKEERFNQMLYTLAATNCFNGLLHESDIGMRNSSKNLLVSISEALRDMTDLSAEEKAEIRVFLDSVIIPRIRGGICHKEENRFSDFLQVFISFIKNGQDLHGTFKELDKVVTPQIIEGLQDLQIHLRTRAMNKLSKQIADVGKNVSPTILKIFVLPLANHNLLDEDKLGKNINELIDSSIEVLRTILTLLPHEHYFKYLTSLVDNPKRNTSLAKQYERILVAAMDAFHFDLSLASYDPQPQGVSAQVVVESESNKEENPELTDVDKEPVESDDEEEGVEDTEDKALAPIVVELTVLPKSAAIKCLKLLKTVVIPKLRKYLNFEEKATHKLSRADKTVDNDVILKIPCTIALVKLLKKIPKTESQNAIRSIIPSLCAGLRNQLVSVRNTLRKTLLNVIKELGIWNFRTVISYLKSSLLRGYQKHVLNYTVGYLMKCLESELRSNPEHLPIKEILPLCEDELYGVMQEEKELAAIKQKTREASKSNAIPILKLCAKCMQSKSNLRILIEPAVKHLTAKRTPKVAKTTRQWLGAISEGLADNLVLDHLDLIDWLKEVMEKESLEEPTEKGKAQEPEAKKRKLLVETKDHYLIDTAKKKPTADGKITGQFLLTEFSFNCLYNGLNKSNRLKNALVAGDSVDVLNSFVKKLGEGIHSSSKQVNIVSLRCLTLLFEFDLSSFKDLEMVEGLRRSGFTSMNNHCYRTSSDATMTNATFKFLTGFFLRFPEYKINVQDFELMLKCIQSYLTNGECSSAAITLLKGVLRNKFKSAHLPELMEEVFKQSIQSYYQHINEGCRQAYFVYLSNYCTAPKELSMQVQMILNQFDYSVENGRLTAVEIMNSLIDSMPLKSFEEVKDLIFLKTFANLDKETQPKVREKLCEITKTLFRHETKKSLVRLFLKLMNLDKHIPVLDTFFLIAGGVIDDQHIFQGDELVQLLNKIEEVLNPEKFEELCNKADDLDQQGQDYAVYQALVCLKKGLLRKIGGVNLWSNASPVSNTMREIFSHLRNTHLLHEHEWVPVITLDIFTGIFAAMSITGEEMKAICAESIQSGETSNTVLISTEDLSIFLKNVVSVVKFTEREDVQMKAAVILIQLSNVSAQLDDLSIFIDTVGEIKRAVNHEVVKDSKVTKIRALALAIFRGMVIGSPLKSVKEVAEGITRVAVRELTDDGVPASLKVEAEKLTTSLREILGNAEFNNLYAEVNDFFHRKRNDNRAKKKEQVVLHPGLVRKRTKKVFDSSVPFKKKKVNRK